MKKKILLTLLVGFLLIVANAIFYLACYQDVTVKKISRNEEINIYEEASIMTLHAGICTLGSLYSPMAGYAHLRMAVCQRDTIYIHSDKWLSPKIKQRFKEHRLGKMAWDGNKDYAISSKEKDAAILLNYCYLKQKDIKGKPCYVAECPYTWEQPSKTQFNLGLFTITVYEQLFYELEKSKILHPYTLVCYYEIEK